MLKLAICDARETRLAFNFIAQNAFINSENFMDARRLLRKLEMIPLRVCLVFVFLDGISKAYSQVQLTPLGFNASEGSNPVVFACSASLSGTIFFSANTVSVTDQNVQQQRGITVMNVNSSFSILTILPYLINDNLIITCFLGGVGFVDALLLVQGRLPAPPNLIIMEATQSPGLQELSWNPPFTLDLTDQDPDILGYRVCFTTPSVNVDMESSQCWITQALNYSFINVGLLLNFSVAALNPVGDGSSGVVVHQPCTDSEFSFYSSST